MKKYGKKLRKNGIRKWHETEEEWKKKMAEMKRELNGGHEKNPEKKASNLQRNIEEGTKQCSSY